MSNVNQLLPSEFAEEIIPILDFGPYIAGEKGSLDRLGSEIRDAQENVGFYFAINHGVPRALIDRAHENIPNHWPDELLLPAWKAEMLAYYDAMETLGYKMLPVYARALDLSADYFNGMFDDPAWTTRNQHYPPVPAEDNQFGIAPHRDHGFITLLPVTEEPGLQIRTTTGRWLPANTIEGAIIVNTGEFLNRWTNGRFMATPHRVLPTGRDRYSIAFFFNPSWDTVANPLSSCTGPGNPPRFKPVRFLDYRNWYLNQNFLGLTGNSRPEPPSVEESTLKL